MIQEKTCSREYIDGSVYDEDYYERGGHGSLYQGYTKSLLEHPGFKEFARLIVKVFQPERVLEVGCATGIIVNHLRNLGIAAIGIDISDYATRNAVCGDVLRASATDLPFADDSFDLVFGCHCIEHIPPFLLDKAVAEQARVSRRWVFHVMPIWKLGPYQWTLQEREELLKRDSTDLNLEDVVWWINKFTATGRLRYHPDVRLGGVTKLWRDDYNFCQVCFEKEPLLDGTQRQTAHLALLSVSSVTAEAHNFFSAARRTLPFRALRRLVRLLRLLPRRAQAFQGSKGLEGGSEMSQSSRSEADHRPGAGPVSPGEPAPLSGAERPQSPYYGPTVARLSCFSGLPEAAERALEAMSRDESFAGNADPSILNLLDALVSGNDKTHILQLGTLIGFSAVILAGALQRVRAATGAEVRLDTVDFDASKHERARAYLKMAGFDAFVRFIDGNSTDPQVLDQLGDGYDVIFVDSSHNYSQTKREIAAYWPRLKPGGYMVFHDAGQGAAAYDPEQEGGVRRALDEWLESPPDDMHAHLLLEPPYWANPCGVFWAIKSI